MRYVPGRLYEREKRSGKVGHLREERVKGVPVSFQKLNKFLKERRRDLTIYVKETTEKEANVPGNGALDDDQEEEAELGSECEPGNSEDEELFEDDPLGGGGDSEDDI